MTTASTTNTPTVNSPPGNIRMALRSGGVLAVGSPPTVGTPAVGEDAEAPATGQVEPASSERRD